MLDIVPDIINHIFYSLPITDKRNFIRTCKTFYNLSRFMAQIEKEFQKMINDTKFFFSMNFTGFYNPLYKYTIELIYDNYYHLIPNKYIISENRIMYQYKKIYYRIGLNGNLRMIKLFNQKNRISDMNSSYVIKGAAIGGHLNILKWMQGNNYSLDSKTIAYAAKGEKME